MSTISYRAPRRTVASLVSAERLPALGDALDGLSVIDGGGECTADLGPRIMVVWNHDGDLTAAVDDNYGCRSVRLTDDPHATPPGADDQEGTVAGILRGGQAVLDAVGGRRSDR